MGIEQDEREDDICTDVKNYDDLTESDGGIIVELKKKRARKTVIGELVEAKAEIARLSGAVAWAEATADVRKSVETMMSRIACISVTINVVLLVYIFTHKGG